jgi:2-phospho-L-lactate guanylyltransferase (CobY/MobA/RfbA family)
VTRAAVLAAFAGLGAAGLAPAGGCGSSGATCDCADPAITVHVPSDVAASVTSVTLSGAGCTGVTAAPTNQINGGTSYAFTANGIGTCTIDVTFASGTSFSDDLSIVQQTGCCTGFYASPVSAADVEVPEPGDAG